MIDGKTILITGGTGSFGQTIVNKLLTDCEPKEIVILVVMKRNNSICVIDSMIPDLGLVSVISVTVKKFLEQ